MTAEKPHLAAQALVEAAVAGHPLDFARRLLHCLQRLAHILLGGRATAGALGASTTLQSAVRASLGTPFQKLPALLLCAHVMAKGLARVTPHGS